MGTNDKSVSHVEDSPSGDAVPGPARRRRRYVLAGTGVLALAVVGWFGYSAWDVQHDLTGARDNAQLAKNSLLGGDTEGAGTRPPKP